MQGVIENFLLLFAHPRCMEMGSGLLATSPKCARMRGWTNTSVLPMPC